MDISKFKDKTVIFAGCGGGYDIFGCLPLYFQIVNIAKKLILTNFSFTDTYNTDLYSVEILPKFRIFNPDKNKQIDSKVYCPEFRLATELNVPVYGFSDYPTCQQIINSYNYLISKEQIDIIYLVDGGCDVILTGNERELGTPVEDMMHLRAITDLHISEKYIMTIGTNIDVGDGVIQEDLDLRIAHLKRLNILISTSDLNIKNDYVKQYYDIVMRSEPESTIVHSMIAAAIDGNRGYYVPKHLLDRITESLVPLTDQTSCIFIFKLVEIARSIIYLDKIELDMDSDTVDDIISKYTVK